MRKGRRQGLSLLLVLVMLLGLLPGTAWAAEKQISVKVTVYVQGVPALDREGEAMLNRTVNVRDENGDGVYSLDEVLLATHQTYAPNGAEDYQSGFSPEWGSYSVSELWGVETTATGFYKNHKTTNTVDAEMIKEGDRIDAFVYKDQSAWTDRYCYFSQDGKSLDALSTCVGEEFELTLNYDVWGSISAQPTAPIGVFGTDGTYSKPESLRGEWIMGEIYMMNPTTDSDGTVKMSFTTPGTYLLTAQYDSENYTDYYNDPPRYYLVPPLCTVTVYEDTPQGHVNAAEDNLTQEVFLSGNGSLDNLSKNLTLPTSTYDKTTITWSLETQDSSVIGYYPEYGGEYLTTVYIGDAKAYPVSATLTATISSTEDEEIYQTKSFALTVPAAESDDAGQATVVDYGSIMTGIVSNWSDEETETSSITENDLPWAVVDMAAYGSALGTTEQKRYESLLGQSDNAAQSKYILAEYAQEKNVKAPSIPEYPDIWSAPSVLLARIAGGAGESGENTALITCMTSYLTGPERDVDTVAAMLPALAPYYDEPDVKSAVDTAVTWLSSQQSESGAWKGNANSTALVIVGLSALGIDAHTDSRFIKNNKSAVEGLLSFALADNSGFGYGGNVTYNSMATEQGFRALVAYARMKDNNKAYNIYLEAKDSTGVVPAPNITATVKPDGGSGSGGASRVTVTVSVMVPPEGGAEGQYTYYHNSALYTNLLGGSEKVTVSSGTTALSVLKSVLDEADISYQESSGYVTEIGGLAAFDHGPRSGWQYMVNGTAPQESASTYTFTKNSTLVWYFTDDYTKEKDAESWGGGTQTGTGAEIKEQADGSYQVTLPKDSTGSVLVTIPKVSEGDLLVIVHADGTQEVVKKSVVQDGTAYLMLDESATVKVVDYVSDFNDVKENAWYADAVDFTAGRGLFSGVGGGSFAPDETLNRGMVVTVLYALEDAGAQKTAGLFDDVAEDAWYAQGTAWAVEAGIVSGYGDGQFGPNDAITREQLALMLYRYAQYMKLSTGTGASLEVFGDEEEISSWAQQAMSWAVSAGILGGTPEGNLNPGGTATRAEAAVMVSQFVAWMLKSV